MGLADVWSRTLVYFGLAEEDDEDDWDEDGYATHEELERTYAERPNVRRLQPRRNKRDFDDWTESEQANAQARSTVRSLRRQERKLEVAPAPAAASPSVQVHLVIPRSFNDAQQIADRFKEGGPVILNLQGNATELWKRLIDFASGLPYALDGGMQRVADKVFLLTPRNVSVSAEERAKLLERGFFNQA